MSQPKVTNLSHVRLRSPDLDVAEQFIPALLGHRSPLLDSQIFDYWSDPWAARTNTGPTATAQRAPRVHLGADRHRLQFAVGNEPPREFVAGERGKSLHKPRSRSH